MIPFRSVMHSAPTLAEALLRELGVHIDQTVRQSPAIVVFGSLEGTRVVVKLSTNMDSIERERSAYVLTSDLGISVPSMIKGLPGRMNVAENEYAVLVTQFVDQGTGRDLGPNYYTSAGRLLGDLQQKCKPLRGIYPMAPCQIAEPRDKRLRHRQHELEESLRLTDGASRDVGVSHNDFHSGNLLLANQTLVLIDLSAFGDNYLDSDVGNILYELFYSRIPDRERCKDAFLDEYKLASGRSCNVEILSRLAKLNDISELLIRSNRGSIANDEVRALLTRVHTNEPAPEIAWALG